MAVTKIICPECNTVLKPAKPLAAGKPVKCPECGHRFAAPEEDGPTVPLKKPAKKAAAAGPNGGEGKPKKPVGAAKAAPKKPDEKKAAAANKPAAKQSDDDDEGGVYGYVKEEEEEDKPDIEYAPDMSTKDLRGPAVAVLVKPSNALIIVGGLGFLGWVVLLILILIPKLFPIDADDGDKTKPPKPVIGLDHGLQTVNDPADPPAEPKAGDPSRKAFLSLFGFDLAMMAQFPSWAFMLSLMPIFLGMAYSGLVTYGAVKIQNLEGYGWGIASAIMAMFPFNSAGLLIVLTIAATFLLGMALDDPGLLNFAVSWVMVLGSVAPIVVGAWVLIKLRSETVLKGYEYKAE